MCIINRTTAHFLLNLLLSTFITVIAVHPSRAEDAAIDALAQVMDCKGIFVPENMLNMLRGAGYIAAEPKIILDGVPVFAVTKPFQIRGLNVLFVEGWDETGLLFLRGPGTSPGTHIGITVEADRTAVLRQFESAGLEKGPPYLHVLDASAAFDYEKRPGITAVDCNLSY
jgi:hypothetical protein